MIAIIDYGLGNLRSVQKAFESFGANAKIISRPEELRNANKLVIPGVGAFGKGMSNIQALDLEQALREEVLTKGKYVLGICLGMQLMAKSSTEHGLFSGLNWIDGEVQSLSQIAEGNLVPNVGWLPVNFDAHSKLFASIKSGTDFYFVHSYYYQPHDRALEVAAWSECGQKFTCAIEQGNIWATQFHPEKSQKAGIQLLRNFNEVL